MDEILDLLEGLRRIGEQKRDLTKRERYLQQIVLSKFQAPGIDSPEAKDKLREIRQHKRELTRREKDLRQILLSKLRVLGIEPESPDGKDKGGCGEDGGRKNDRV